MRIAIYNKTLHPVDLPYVMQLFNAVREVGMDLLIYKPFLDNLNAQGVKDIPNLKGVFENHDEFVALEADFFITLGGDGTILDSVTIVRHSRIPILGINLGRLGFLANVDKESIAHAIADLQNGAYTLDSRSLLHLESNRQIFGEFNFALNDCTILKRDTSSMVIIHAYINGEFLNSYWADGIIIATPTGSTGYSLSCGGPIVFPNSDNFVITPVAPHNLNVRPIVISDTSVISFEVEGRARNFLCTMDSRYAMIESLDQVAVRKADFQVYLIRLRDRNFLSTIREKLNWGIDIRNEL